MLQQAQFRGPHVCSGDVRQRDRGGRTQALRDTGNHSSGSALLGPSQALQKTKEEKRLTQGGCAQGRKSTDADSRLGRFMPSMSPTSLLLDKSLQQTGPADGSNTLVHPRLTPHPALSTLSSGVGLPRKQSWGR